MTGQLFKSIQNGENFAICRLPNSSEQIEFFSSNNQLVDIYGRVWIAHPFDENESKPHKSVSTSKREHLEAVQLAIDSLHTPQLNKVVVSKIKCVTLVGDVTADIIEKAFQILERKYPSAFVFIYRMNVHSVWFGATPETLIEKQNGQFRTMSLAGTRLKSSIDLSWGVKEMKEQSIVTDYISNLIRNNLGMDIQIDGPRTVNAAHLEHLQSIIDFKSDKSLEYWAKALHPTPAVCGMPLNEARNLISQIELHPRKMYAGYIGFFDQQGNGNVFVQLRCMEWTAGQAYIYSGGGIMPDSIPESEWEEAENKANVMLTVLAELKN